jgi:hypothetical protein
MWTLCKRPRVTVENLGWLPFNDRHDRPRTFPELPELFERFDIIEVK